MSFFSSSKFLAHKFPAPKAGPARIASVDLARGALLVAMFVYHLAWDAHYFGLSAVDPSAHAGWKLFSHSIASGFLFLAGVSLVLADRRGATTAQIATRLARLAAAAAVVSLATYLAVPEAFISFGILHCILVASLLALPVRRLPLPLLALAGLGLAVAPWFFAGLGLDSPWLGWTGLNATAPRTLDYRPLLPWAGALFAGVVAARLWPPGRTLHVPVQLQALALAGRHSLAIYLLHQPIFLSLLFGLATLLPAVMPEEAAPFLAACQNTCKDAGRTAPACTASCTCVADWLKAAELWSPALHDQLDAAATARLQEMAQTCRDMTSKPGQNGNP